MPDNNYNNTNTEEHNRHENGKQKDQSPCVGKLAHGFIFHHHLLSQVLIGTVGREIDQRAEHLKIGDHGIHLRNSGGVAVEIADLGFWIPLGKLFTIRGPGVGRSLGRTYQRKSWQPRNARQKRLPALAGTRHREA